MAAPAGLNALLAMADDSSDEDPGLAAPVRQQSGSPAPAAPAMDGQAGCMDFLSALANEVETATVPGSPSRLPRAAFDDITTRQERVQGSTALPRRQSTARNVSESLAKSAATQRRQEPLADSGECTLAPRVRMRHGTTMLPVLPEHVCLHMC